MKNNMRKILTALPSINLLLLGMIGSFSAQTLSAEGKECNSEASNYQECDNQLGWFIGAEAGMATTSLSTQDINEFYSLTGINANAIDVDDKGIGGGLFLGYQFTSVFSLQAGYISLGERSVSFNGSSTDLASYYANAEKVYPQSGEGLSIHAAMSIPLSENIKLSAKAGIFDWEGDFLTNEVAQQVGRDKIDGRDAWYGLELNYRLKNSVQLYASASRFQLDRDDNHLYSIGVRYFWDTPKPIDNNNMTAMAAQRPEDILDIESSLPVDTDQDSIVDSIDACPNSDTQYIVDARGCTIMRELSVEQTLTIYFAHSSAQIIPEYDDKITEFISSLNPINIKNITIKGHTSALGTIQLNQLLSEKRAQALAEILANDYNLVEFEIENIGLGETMLLDTNDNEEAHSKNRRVELTVEHVVMEAIAK